MAHLNGVECPRRHDLLHVDWLCQVAWLLLLSSCNNRANIVDALRVVQKLSSWERELLVGPQSDLRLIRLKFNCAALLITNDMLLFGVWLIRLS